jgi:glycosyltransferase involved in cell wall biosynthesis
MKISVIIPVYNAEEYVRNAVESALQQLETGEILLVEDNSPDNCLQLCRDLEKQHEKVRLLRHADGRNHGAGASRNLGIRNAKFEYIAFLDADDYYLPCRFEVARKLFEEYHHIDGVYEAVRVHFHDVKAERKWRSIRGKDITTMTERVASNRLFEVLIKGKKGTIHLDGLTVRKRIFGHSGYFFENLRLHQDTAMIVQMSVCSKLIPGRLDTPVAMRTIHDQNRITGDYNRLQTRFLYCRTLFYWAIERHLKKSIMISLFLNYVYCSYALLKGNGSVFTENWPQLKSLIAEVSRHPFLFVRAVIQFFVNKMHSSSSPCGGS